MTADPNRIDTPGQPAVSARPTRLDLLIAVGIGLLAVLIYALALAPDILYSDSGEFQTLAYTWGTTHTTGYPVYLLLARIAGFIPLETMAWRISFFSALSAGFTLGALYLLVRFFTGRAGGLLACATLLVSYTFWSQSIITEVYAPASAFITLILLLLLLWRENPVPRGWLVFLAGLLLGAGLGVHMFLALIAPAVGIFVLWGLLFGAPGERRNWTHLARLVAGGVCGLAIFYGLFAFMDSRPTPTNFLTTGMVPSRSAWNLSAEDLDSTPERFLVSVTGVQWRDAMLRADADYREDFETFTDDYLPREYTRPTLVLALLGAVVGVVRHRRKFALVAVVLAVAFTAGLVYHPGDQYIFYLPAYLMLALLAGVGAGSLVTWLAHWLPGSLRWAAAALLTLVLVGLCVQPMLPSRLLAMQTGESRFVEETYAYPVENLAEPRRAAECAVSKVAEDNAYLVLNWRALYSIYYVAHVEQGRTGLVIREVKPHGTDVITETLMEEIAAQVASGVPVYVDNADPALRRLFNVATVGGDCRDYTLFRVTPRP
jgi:hypothetical protein